MTAITLNLPDEVEQKLQVRAKFQGKDISSIAAELVEQGLQAEKFCEGPQPLTPEDRARELEEWVRSLPTIDVVLDVSRESIYEGRGE